jgi:D-glycero-alpha-D-manno-heptose 1-phosphate guanylyltransferase
MPRSAVILVGGLGTRVRHLLQGRPKPLALVAGRPFLEWVLLYLRGQGIDRVVLAAGYAGEQVEAFAAKVTHPGMHLQVVTEPQPRGTAGAFLHAWSATGGDDANVLVLNGDSLALAPLGPLYSALGNNAGALLAAEVRDVSRYGSVTVDPQGRLTGFAEKRTGGGRGVINAGVYLFSRGALDAFPAAQPLSFETDVFPALIASGAHVQVATAACPFLDIGTEASMGEADRFIEDNRRWFSE